MPRKPAIKSLNANSAQILNTIKENASPFYRSMVPDADIQDTASLRAIGNVLINNDGLMNEFLTALINRVGMVWVSSKLYSNPWAFMKKGMMELGEVIEEIFVSMAMPHHYNPQVAEEKVFEREIPDVDAVFHKLNYQFFYKQTIQNDSLRQAFLSWDGVTDLIARIVDAMYSAVAYDEFLITKYMISMALVNGNMATEVIPEINTDNMRPIVSVMKSASNLLTFNSTNYNQAGVLTYTDKNDQYIIINSRFDADMAVEVLATSFNMDKASLMGRVVLVDDFGTFDTQRMNLLIPYIDKFTPITTAQLNALKDVPAILLDRNWFMIFDQLLKFTEIYNNEGLYWNYTLHTWKVFSYSPYNNAVAFVTTQPTVTAVSVSPSAVTIEPGQEAIFTATVTGSEFVDKGVTWSVDNENAQIMTGGRVRLKSSATGTVTVTATSKEDNTKSGTATITVGSASGTNTNTVPTITTPTDNTDTQN